MAVGAVELSVVRDMCIWVMDAAKAWVLSTLVPVIGTILLFRPRVFARVPAVCLTPSMCRNFAVVPSGHRSGRAAALQSRLMEWRHR